MQLRMLLTMTWRNAIQSSLCLSACWRTPRAWNRYEASTRYVTPLSVLVLVLLVPASPSPALSVSSIDSLAMIWLREVSVDKGDEDDGNDDDSA